MKNKSLRKGYIYTLSAIMLTIPLLMLIVYYYGLTGTGIGTTKLGETGVEETAATGISSKIRCDELHYFVEDTKMSLSRGLLIGGRRAAIYTLNQISNGTPIPVNYTMQKCALAENIVTPLRGAEAAIAELLVCGTYKGAGSEYMLNNTLSAWRDKITRNADRADLKLNMSFGDVDIMPYDAWHFVVVTKTNFNVTDNSEICHFAGYNTTVISISSIIDIEDPMYPLRTSSRIYKYITPCSEPEYIPEIKMGVGTRGGNGNSGGRALFLSKINGTIDADKIKYCASHIEQCITDVDDPKKVVLVIDNSDVLDDLCGDPDLKANMSLYGGVIDFNCSSAEYTCLGNLTIPYVIGTGDIGGGSGTCPKNGCLCTNTSCGAPQCENCTCFGDSIICDAGGVSLDCSSCSSGGENCLQNDSCVFLSNNGTKHIISRGINCGEISTSCYYISNVSKYKNANTTCSKLYSDGPCFFDRLEGSLNLSVYYKNRQRVDFCRLCNDSRVEWFGKNSYCPSCESVDIGFESFVDLEEFDNRKLFEDHILNPYSNETLVDYLYFLNQNYTVNSCSVYGCYCSGYMPFNIDCQHAFRYGIYEAKKSCS